MFWKYTDNPSLFGGCMEIVCLVVWKIHFLIQQCLQEFCMVSCMLALHIIEFLIFFVVYIFSFFCVLSLPPDLESFTPNLPSSFSISTAFLVPSMFFVFLACTKAWKFWATIWVTPHFPGIFRVNCVYKGCIFADVSSRGNRLADQCKKVTISLLNIDTVPKKVLLKAEVLLVTAQKSCLVKDNVEIALFSR